MAAGNAPNQGHIEIEVCMNQTIPQRDQARSWYFGILLLKHLRESHRSLADQPMKDEGLLQPVRQEPLPAGLGDKLFQF